MSVSQKGTVRSYKGQGRRENTGNMNVYQVMCSLDISEYQTRVVWFNSFLYLTLMCANWRVRKQQGTICTTHIHVWTTTKHHFSTYLKETENRYGNLALTKQELESPSLLWFHNHDKGSTMKHMQLSQINTAKKTEVEKVDLGLPLQGPGWTDYACVQGYVGMHVIP